MIKQSHSLSIIFGILIGLLVVGNQLGMDLPIVQNDRTSLIVLGFLGMALCSQGIGRIAEDHRWGHPISLLGMLIGAVILILWGGRILNYDLPYAAADAQAILTLGILMGVKFILARLYPLFRKVPRIKSGSA